MAPPRRASRRFTLCKQCIFRTGIVLILSLASFNIWWNAGGLRGAPVDVMPRDTLSTVPPKQLIIGNTNENTNTNRKHTSRPLEILQEYQQFHSQKVLLEEHENGGIHNRTFVVGFYACPDAAGNRLHEFFNSMIIALAHNYTITWKFFDEWTCRAVGTKYVRKFCKNAVNSLETCGAVVERASWIASYDDWSGKLNMTFGDRNKLVESYHHIPNDNKVWAPKERNVPVSLEKQGQVKDPIASERLKELYSLGTYYVYGMLFHELFPFHDSVQPSADLVGGDKDEISIVLHSRHVKDHINGTDVSKEIHCVQDIMKQHEAIGTNLDKCRIFLMSDRQTTLDGLEQWITQHTKCRTVIAKHDTEKGKFYEHGPFAMKGFFQDLALAAHTNGGFIGALAVEKCSSADLIRDLYEYNHFVLNDGKDNVGSPLHCGIPKHK